MGVVRSQIYIYQAVDLASTVSRRQKEMETNTGARRTSPSVAPDASKFVEWGLKSRPLTGPLCSSYFEMRDLETASD